MDVTTRLLTAEEFAALPEDRWVSELVRGRVVNVPPPGMGHGGIQAALAARLIGHVKVRGLGRVVVGSGVILERGPDTVRAPDVALFLHGDGDVDPLPTGYAETLPDLAVEIVSPSDSRPAARRKAESYLAAGIPLVWIVDPRMRTVRVYAAGVATRVLREGEVLDGGGVLPGFAMPVAEILAA